MHICIHIYMISIAPNGIAAIGRFVEGQQGGAGFSLRDFLLRVHSFGRQHLIGFFQTKKATSGETQHMITNKNIKIIISNKNNMKKRWRKNSLLFFFVNFLCLHLSTVRQRALRHKHELPGARLLSWPRHLRRIKHGRTGQVRIQRALLLQPQFEIVLLPQRRHFFTNGVRVPGGHFEGHGHGAGNGNRGAGRGQGDPQDVVVAHARGKGFQGRCRHPRRRRRRCRRRGCDKCIRVGAAAWARRDECLHPQVAYL